MFPTGRNWARGKHAVAAETIWTVSLFPTHPNNQPSGIAKGTKALLRPWQLLFPPARGAGALLCPWQLLFSSCQGHCAPFLPLAIAVYFGDSPAVDQVHFDALYQVHHPCPKTVSEPHSVYQVHPMKSDLVHLSTKTITTRGAETLLRPGRLPLSLHQGHCAPFLPLAITFSSCQGH